MVYHNSSPKKKRSLAGAWSDSSTRKRTLKPLKLSESRWSRIRTERSRTNSNRCATSVSTDQTPASPPMMSPYPLSNLAKWISNTYRSLTHMKDLTMPSRRLCGRSVHCMRLGCSRATSLMREYLNWLRIRWRCRRWGSQWRKRDRLLWHATLRTKWSHLSNGEILCPTSECVETSWITRTIWLWIRKKNCTMVHRYLRSAWEPLNALRINRIRTKTSCKLRPKSSNA